MPYVPRTNIERIYHENQKATGALEEILGIDNKTDRDEEDFYDRIEKRWEELEEQRRRVRESALQRLAEAEERIQRASQKALGQLQVQRQMAKRLAERAAAVTGLSSGALAQVLSQMQEPFTKGVLGLQAQTEEALARIAAAKADVEAEIPLRYDQLINQLMALEAQYMQAQAMLMQAQPPSFFDRLIQAGGLLALGAFLL